MFLRLITLKSAVPTKNFDLDVYRKRLNIRMPALYCLLIQTYTSDSMPLNHGMNLCVWTRK